MASLKSFVFALIELAKRWPWLIAGIGFISGLASYFLVERKESLAQVIAILMLVSWVFLVLENWLRESFKSRFGLNIPPALMHYLTQLVHQESFCFAVFSCRHHLESHSGRVYRFIDFMRSDLRD